MTAWPEHCAASTQAVGSSNLSERTNGLSDVTVSPEPLIESIVTNGASGPSWRIEVEAARPHLG